MEHTDLCFTSATQLARLIQGREISPVELMQAILSRIERLQPQINAFSTVCADKALEASRKAESEIVRGKSVGPLHGIPFSVKDLLWTKGVRTTFGSYILENYLPDEDAPCVQRLKEAGAILIGKTTTPEFGHKAITDSPLFGITRNPWNLDRTPGGSSGGAGALVAAGLGPLAIGTDGGGSIRIPASCTGIVGLKPTLGRIPHPQSLDVFGTLSHIGPMTRTVADAALMLEVMAGPDVTDPYSYGLPKETYQSSVTGKVRESLKGWKIAWSPTLGNTEVDNEVLKLIEAAVQVFAEFGCELEEARPDFDLPEEHYLVLFHSSLAARLGPYLERFRDKIDPCLRDAIKRGSQYGAVDLQRAHYVRTQLFQTVQQFFKKFDLLITPTLSAPALPVTHNALEPIAINGKIAGSVRSAWYPYTYPFNMAGNPAISIPCGWTRENLPVGLQIVGPWLAEDPILQAAAEFELARPWSSKTPPL
jgi:aspartyl-tRNA(Asn)/glutamyl-tRNA(Gln) amidotransferase subunit A